MIIDPRPFKAELERAQAILKQVETQAAYAEKEYNRAKKLIKTEAISQSQLDEKTNVQTISNAEILAAEAAVETAKINLDYAYVKAPISGKVSRAEITEGNLVQAGLTAPLLTTIVADERVYIDFEVDEQTYIKYVRGTDLSKYKIPVKINIAGEKHDYAGYIDSFDNQIDPFSGTIRARAIFDNSDKGLLPGMSVSVMMGAGENQKQIMVSERAIGTDQDRKFVLVIDEKNIATYRAVSVGKSLNGRRVIKSGLNEGDRVITEGIVRVRPGMPVVTKSELSKTLSDVKTSSGAAQK